MRVIGTGADLGGGCKAPPPTRLSNTTGILQKKTLWFIYVEVKYKTRWRIVNGLAANLKKNGPYI